LPNFPDAFKAVVFSDFRLTIKKWIVMPSVIAPSISTMISIKERERVAIQVKNDLKTIEKKSDYYQ
jgi:hypothetical protein